MKNNINTAMLKDIVINFLVPLICFGLIVLLFIFALFPSIKALPALKKDLADSQVKKTNLDSKYMNLNKLSSYKSILAENSALLNKVLESESKVPELLDQISQMAGSAGLKITRLNYSFSSTSSDEADAGTPKPAASAASANTEVDISMGAQGSYDQLISFLSIVENAARNVNVTNFRYSLVDAEGGPVLDLSFSLMSPYLFVQSNAITDDPLNLDISNKDFVSFLNKIKALKYYEFNAQNPLPVPTPTPETAKESTASE
jgi:Tfp pilus assembly protein PilO